MNLEDIVPMGDKILIDCRGHTQKQRDSGILLITQESKHGQEGLLSMGTVVALGEKVRNRTIPIGATVIFSGLEFPEVLDEEGILLVAEKNVFAVATEDDC